MTDRISRALGKNDPLTQDAGSGGSKRPPRAEPGRGAQWGPGPWNRARRRGNVGLGGEAKRRRRSGGGDAESAIPSDLALSEITMRIKVQINAN
jgi:hypothetical protein